MERQEAFTNTFGDLHYDGFLSHEDLEDDVFGYGSMLPPVSAAPSGDIGSLSQSFLHKEDNELRNAAADTSARDQSMQDFISITIVDSEGPRIYFQKSYRLGIKTNIKKAMDQIRGHVCTTCSSPRMLEFWYETTELKNGQTATLLGMQQGDTIDIRLKEGCTRGAHPLPASQTTPNMHYLDIGVFSALAEDRQPPAQNKTVNLTFRNDTRFSLIFRLRIDHPILKACEAFEVRLGSSVGSCRFHSEGNKLDRTKTPRELELEDSDIIEAYTEILGGGGPPRYLPYGNYSAATAAATGKASFHHPTHKPLPARPSPSSSLSSSSSEEDTEDEIVTQVSLLFIDSYSHTFTVTIPNNTPLLQALKHAAFRMGKNESNCAFDISGTRIDLEILGTKTAIDLGLEGKVEVKVWWDCPTPTSAQTDPDDGLSPRSVRYGVRPPRRQTCAEWRM